MNDASSIRITVDTEGRQERLDKYLVSQLPQFSRSRIQRALDSQLIYVNDTHVSKNHRIKDGDTITIYEEAIVKKEEPDLTPENIPLDILYEDDDIVVVNKSAGMVVHPARGNWSGTLVNALLHRYNNLASGHGDDRPGIVHRLDKETSGVIITAKNDKAHELLANDFSQRTLKKIYIGFCVGRRPQPYASIDAPIARAKGNPLVRAVRRGGKEALTEYWCQKYTSGISLLTFRLHTGRTHQIRVHCRHNGFPILQDEMYEGGRDRVMLLPPLDRPFAHKILKCFERHALHAWKLSIVHPISQEELHFTAPLPDDFKKAIAIFMPDFMHGLHEEK